MIAASSPEKGRSDYNLARDVVGKHNANDYSELISRPTSRPGNAPTFTGSNPTKSLPGTDIYTIILSKWRNAECLVASSCWCYSH
jgi:hypothetical protein